MKRRQSLTLALIGTLVVACEQPRAGAESSPPREPTIEQFKGIHIYRRQSDGSWRITHDVFNAPAPSTATKP